MRSIAAWYILWTALLIISAGNALSPYPIFSSSLGLIFSFLLAAIAGIQLMLGTKFLSQKERRLAAVILVVFGIVQCGYWVRTLASPSVYRGFDFSAYYLAAKVVSATPGQSLYYLPLYSDGRMDMLASSPIYSAWQAASLHYDVPFSAPFIYPPFFAVMMRPIAALPFASAYTAWEIITMLLVAGAVLLTFKLAGVRVSRKLALLLGVGLFAYSPICECLFAGQVGGLILFLLTASVWLLAKNYTSLSALSFAAATMIKLTPVLAVPLLIFHRRWKWLAAYVGWLSVLLAMSVWQAGWEAHRQFWSDTLPKISCGAAVDLNSSIVAYVQELFLGYLPIAPHAASALPPYACVVSRMVALSVYVLMLVRFYVRRCDHDLVRDLILMALLGLAVSPISWSHHYVIALLPLLYLWCKMPVKGIRVLVALYIAVGSNIVGYLILMVDNPVAKLILAPIVPGLTIALVYVSLGSGASINAPLRVFRNVVSDYSQRMPQG